MVGLAILGGVAWHAKQSRDEERRAERERLTAILSVGDHARLRELEEEHGFGALAEGPWALVPLPEGQYVVPLPFAARAHGGRAAGPLDGAGVLVSGSPAGVELDPAHWVLEARADRPSDIQWVAFVRRREIPDRYEYDGQWVSVERVDLRLVRLVDGRLLAEATAEAIPPAYSDNPAPHYPLEADEIAAAVTGALKAAAEAPPLRFPIDLSRECLYRFSPAHASLDRSSAPTCPTEPNGNECRNHCRRGHAESCLYVGWDLEAVEDEERLALAAEHGWPTSRELFGLACAFGHRSGCVNWAAGVYVDGLPAEDSETDPQLVCAVALFEQACADEEHWGCGMLARARMEGHGTPRDRAGVLSTLEEQCSHGVGGGTCQVLGEYQARGAYGPAGRERARESFDRACEQGVPSACELSAADFEMDRLPPKAGVAETVRGSSQRP
jgi:hypothetical protein